MLYRMLQHHRSACSRPGSPVHHSNDLIDPASSFRKRTCMLSSLLRIVFRISVVFLMSSFMSSCASFAHRFLTDSFRIGFRAAVDVTPIMLQTRPRDTLFARSLFMKSFVTGSISPWEPHCFFCPYVSDRAWLWSETVFVTIQAWLAVRCSLIMALHPVLQEAALGFVQKPCTSTIYISNVNFCPY